MTSRVDPSVPASPIAHTADVRLNFQRIKEELEALQEAIASGLNADSPQFTGTIAAVNAALSGTLAVNGALTATSIVPLATQTPPVTALAPLSAVTGGVTFTKMPDGVVHLSGTVTFSYTAQQTQTDEGQIVATGGLNAAFRPSATLGVVQSTTSGFFFVVRVFSDGKVAFLWGVDRSTASSSVTGAGHVVNFTGSYKP